MCDGTNPLRHELSLIAPRIEPEEIVARIADSRFGQQGMSGTQLSLCLIDVACRIVVKDEAVAVLELADASLTLLPSGRRTEKHSVPSLIEQSFAIVVPGSIDHSCCAKSLAVTDEALDVDERNCIVGIDAVPTADARRNPRFH